MSTLVHPVEISPGDIHGEHVSVRANVDEFAVDISVTNRLPGQPLNMTPKCTASIATITSKLRSSAVKRSHTMLEFLKDNFLSQSVSEPTRGNNILDLVTVSQDCFTNNVTADEHLGSCDRNLWRASYINTITKKTRKEDPSSKYQQRQF